MDCSRCRRRVGEKRLTGTKVIYDEADYRLSLCSGCHQEWDWGIWGWLNVASEEPLPSPVLACFRCGGYPAEDQVQVGYLRRTWYFRLCDTDSRDWTAFVWGWLRIAEEVARPFEWATPVRLREVPQPPESPPAPRVPALGVAPKPSEVARLVGRPSAPASRYRFRAHALDRMARREISEEAVYRVLDAHGKTVLPDRTKEGVLVHRLGDIGVVVDVSTDEIITVYWRGETA